MKFRHLVIRTLPPNRVRLEDLSSLALRFLWDINIPSALIGSLGQWNWKGSTKLCLQRQSHKTLVLNGFNLRPETAPKALLADLQLLHKSEVSSADWFIFIFLKQNLNTLSFSNLHAKISTARIDKATEATCRTPRVSWKGLVHKALLIRELSRLTRIDIHRWVLSPKLKSKRLLNNHQYQMPSWSQVGGVSQGCFELWFALEDVVN